MKDWGIDHLNSAAGSATKARRELSETVMGATRVEMLIILRLIDQAAALDRDIHALCRELQWDAEERHDH